MARNPESFPPSAASADDAIAQAAAEWVVRHDRELTPEERRAFDAWKAADARHATEWDRIRVPWAALSEVGAVSRLTTMADIVEARARRRQVRHKRLVRTSVFFAAAAAAIALVFFGWRRPAGDGGSRTAQQNAPASYRVLASTARVQTLADGSVAELNGDSRIETDFTPAERRVRLVQGEAHFAVAKNPARPFLVSAGGVIVRAVGTAFDVRLAADSVDVLVTEGTVRLEGAAPGAPTLVAGQRAVIDLSRRGGAVVVTTPSRDEIDSSLAWKSEQLVFEHTPLADVIAAFNQRNSPRLELADPALRSRPLTGVIRADNLEGLLHSLAANVDVVAERRPDGVIVLRPAR